MSYSAKAIANYFIEEANTSKEPITPMKLLKLVYFAHGWYWAIFNERLIDERIEAWKFGPVVPSLYHEFKQFGVNPITCLAMDFEDGTLESFIPRVPEDANLKGFLHKIWDVYGKFTASQLSALTHQQGTPWQTVWEKEGQFIKGTDIPDDLIKAYFLEKTGN